jgi:hypothetical protein
MNNLTEDDLREIIKNFASCKDIMNFAQTSKDNNSFIKDNIKNVLRNFIKLQPNDQKTYWAEALTDVLNDPLSGNDLVYRKFVNACIKINIRQDPNYRPGTNGYYINDSTTVPEYQLYKEKYNYLISQFNLNDYEAHRYAIMPGSTIEKFVHIYNIYLRFKDTDKPIDLNFIGEIYYLSNATIENFISIYDSINYRNLSNRQKVIITVELANLFEKSGYGVSPGVIVNRVIRIYNTIVTTDPNKANRFINEFVSGPSTRSKYVKLLKKSDIDEEIIEVIGGKKRKTNRKTNRKTYRKTYRKTNRKTNRKTKRKTYKKK